MIRDTKQRRAIQEVFASLNRPLSVEEVLDHAKLKVTGLGVATVYRNVKSLVDDGTLIAVELPGEASRYELSGKGHHHHFLCDRCGRVFDIAACIQELRKMIPRSFELTGHEIVLYGNCPACRV